jgi:hypothetical protein
MTRQDLLQRRNALMHVMEFLIVMGLLRKMLERHDRQADLVERAAAEFRERRNPSVRGVPPLLAGACVTRAPIDRQM